MAHELTIRADGRAEMAFVGETPWHGLGQAVTKGASIGVWAKEAGMGWTAKESAVCFEKEKPDGDSYLSSVPSHKVLYRSDTGNSLAVVGAGYEVVQPGDVLEFFRDLTEHGGWWIHTAGVLREGRKVWALASNGETGTIGKKDQVNRNLLLATSLDGSMRTIAMETAVRVVCANTLAFALTKTGLNKTIQVSHRSIFDPDLIKRTLGVNQDSFKVFMEQAKEMADTPIKLDDAREVLRSIFKIDQAPKTPATSWMGNLASMSDQAEPDKDPRALNLILALFQGAGKGATMPSAKGTVWGALNAVTEYVDHDMGRTQDTILDSAWFGRGAGLKADAFKAFADFAGIT